jgi:hypothetical protein
MAGLGMWLAPKLFMGEAIAIFIFVGAMAALAFANIWSLRKGPEQPTKDDESERERGQRAA